MKYTALFIDIKNSRGYDTNDRNLIQNYMLELISVLNKMFNNTLVKNMTFSAGDEIQGLFSSTEAAYLYCRIFKMLISPIKIYIGIGVGEWNVVIDNPSSTVQDGSAYHNARYAINNVKGNSNYSILIYSDTSFDYVVNSLIQSNSLIKSKNSEYKNQIMLLQELLAPLNINNQVNYDSFYINKIIEVKRTFNKNFSQTSNNTKFTNLFEIIKDNSLQNVTSVDVLEYRNNFIIEQNKKKGLSTALSELIGISRQSIDKTIKTGYLDVAKLSDIATIKFIYENYKDNKI